MYLEIKWLVYSLYHPASSVQKYISMYILEYISRTREEHAWNFQVSSVSRLIPDTVLKSSRARLDACLVEYVVRLDRN